MPRKRKTEDLSPPTLLKWMKIYLIETRRMIREGRIYEAEGKQVARGINHAIKHLEESARKYRNSNLETQRKEYEEAVEYFS